MSTVSYCGQAREPGDSETVCRMEPATQARARQVAAELAAAAGPALPGTLTARSYALRQAPLPLPRRPAPAARPLLPQWTRKIAGKTVTRRLTPEQLDDWQPLFDNARAMRDLLASSKTSPAALADPRRHATPDPHPNPANTRITLWTRPA